MRIESDAYLATRAVEERDDAALYADAQPGDAQQEAGPDPAAPPAAAEAGVQTLRVMARESGDIVRRFERPRRVIAEPIERESLPARTPAAQAVAALTTAAPTVAAPAAPVVQAAPAPTPAAAAPVASGYVGERPVDASWLADREKALTAIRADYESARAQAQATQGSGPGWIAAVTVTDESGQVRSASGRALVFVADPNAPQVVAGYDESGPIYRPNGQWMGFDEDAFAAHYRAQGDARLQSLAALYGTDSATLFAQHPEMWRIATSDHALNAGPPPAGRAMGDPGQLGMLDLYMADPQIAGLIQAYGGQPQPATSDIAREQVRIYGQERYDQLTKLGHAMDSVRQQYSDAMAQAQASGAGPGWVERARTITVTDESGQHTTQTVYVTDESGQPLRDGSGQPQAVMERIFDPDAFTAWYEQQGGLQHQAFANFYGASHSTYATDESGRSFASNIAFDNPNWSMYGVGGAMGHKDLIGINPNAPPDLRNREAVGFDLEAGWATAHGNIKEKRDWFESVVQVAIVAAVSYVSAGTLGPAAAGAMGLSTTTVAGAMVSAAVAGAATSVASGMMSGNLTLKGVLQGALAGGLSAGLMTQFGPAVNAVAGNVGTLALRTTVQGGIQALLGGHFKDGALAGFAGGLADMASANMQANISEAVKNGTMDATQAASARMFARVMGSAIRAMGNPDDPSHAFASAFLTDVMEQSGSAAPAPSATTELPTGGQDEVGAKGIEPATMPESLQAAFRGSERDYRSATDQSVDGVVIRARPGDSISSMLGTSDPQAIGNFMRANNLVNDHIDVGRNYFVPDDVNAYGDSGALGQLALNQGNQRNAEAERSELQRELNRFAAMGEAPNAEKPWSFREASMAQRKLDDARALAEYRARLNDEPMQYIGPVDVAAQRAAEIRRESLLNFLNGQGSMALGGVLSAGVMIGTGDIVAASQATDVLGPFDNLLAPLGGGSSTRLGRVRGSRPIDYAKAYEVDIRNIYGGVPFQSRTFESFVDGKWLNGVADNVVVLNGKNTAIEAKYVDDWATSLRNPASPEGGRPWAVAEQQRMIEQAVKYSRAFDQAIYHTNSPELANYYSSLFRQAGITNFEFVITPPKP